MAEQQPSEERWQDHGMGEKAEKEEEKREKEHEKEEKSWEEKQHRDPLYAPMWALILIWAGIVFLLDNTGQLAPLLSRETVDAWNVIFLGAGGIVFLKALAHLLIPAYRKPVFGTILFAAILLAIGLSGLFPSGLVWAVVLIALGVLILLRGLIRRR